MLPNYKERMADVISMLDKQKEMRKQLADVKDRNMSKQIETQARQVVNQKALNEVFDSFMHKEYQDDQIGDLEGDEGIDPLAFIEGEEVEEVEIDEEKKEQLGEEEMYDYGELSDMDDMMESNSMIGMSNADKLEMKHAQDNVMIPHQH